MPYLLAAPSTLENVLSRAPAFLFPCFQTFITSFPMAAAACLLCHWLPVGGLSLPWKNF